MEFKMKMGWFLGWKVAQGMGVFVLDSSCGFWIKKDKGKGWDQVESHHLREWLNTQRVDTFDKPQFLNHSRTKERISHAYIKLQLVCFTKAKLMAIYSLRPWLVIG